MTLLTIILILLAAGVFLWAVNSLVPMQATVKALLNVVVILALVILLLKAFGVLDYLSRVRI